MSLKVWLPLNNSIHNQGLLGDFTVGTSPTYVDGKIGKALSGGSLSMTAEQTNSVLNNNAFSICFWIYPNQASGTSHSTALFGNDGMTAPNNRRFWLYHYPTCNLLHLSWQNYDSNNTALSYVSTTDLMPSYTWTHVAVTYNKTDKKVIIYKNGEVFYTYTNAPVFTSPNYSFATTLMKNDSTRYLNDYRVYDHCLTPSEVKEISKGLVAHYTLGSMDVYEATTNRFTYPTPGSAVGAIGWNQSLHPNAINVSGWSNGYNSGVTDPGTVYHAMWNVIEGVPTMVFLDLNSTKGHTHSWLGINGGTTDASLFTSGRKYTVSFTAKSSVNGGAISCGLYYKRTSSESYSFYDGDILTNLTTTWKRYSITYTSQGANSVSSFYFYGHKGNEGIKYVKDVLLELLDHATPYVISSRSTGIVYDISGYCRNGTISGTISPTDSVRYDKSIYLDGTSAINIGNLATYVPDGNFTFNIWFYKDGYSSKGYDTIFGGPSGFEINTKPHYSGEPDYHICPHSWGSNHTTTTEIPYELNKWYMLTMVRTSSNTKWYLNGELNKTLNAGSIPSGNYFIGAWNSASQQNFRGRVSDCRIYATALSADDVTALYNLGLV